LPESGDIRGIIIHESDYTVTPGTALDVPAVGLVLKGPAGEEHRFTLSRVDAQQLAKALSKAAGYSQS
jgi:hypothetical protein